MSNTIKLSLISVALLSQLQAQETVTLKPIAITSTAIATDELKSTDAVEVYTQEDVEKAHVQNVYEFLNQQTSISTMSNYGNPFAQKLDMHGYGSSNGNQNIVITINGRKINNIDLVPQLLSAIPPSSISKIEIIKSSGIVVGGDGANAGVINIMTKKNNDKEISFSLGNYGSADGSFYLGHKDEKLSLSLVGETQKSDGIRDIDTAGNKDENSQSTAALEVAYLATEALEVRFGAAISKSSVAYAASLTLDEYNSNPAQKGSRTSNDQGYTTNTLSTGLSYYINDDLSFNVDVSKEDKDSTYETLYTNANIYNSLARYRYITAKSTLEYEANHISFVAGVDAFYGERKSSSNSDFGFGASSSASTTDKDNIAVFVMGKYEFGKNSLKAGYRHEKVSYSYDDKSTSLDDSHSLDGVELGYNYTLSKEKSLFLSYAHAYQAPDIDRFFATTYPPPAFQAVVGFNGFINPMKSDTVTLGYNQFTKNNKLKVSAYYINLTDEIYLEPVTFKNTNIDKSHKYGLDLYDKYVFNEKFNFIVNYNYVQAIIDKAKEGANDYADKKLPGVSNHSAKLILSYLPNEFSTITLSQVYRSESYATNDFGNNFTQKQDAYNSTDFSVTLAKDNWEVFAKINNLFNQKNGLWIKDNAVYPINFTTTGLVGFKLKY